MSHVTDRSYTYSLCTLIMIEIVRGSEMWSRQHPVLQDLEGKASRMHCRGSGLYRGCKEPPTHDTHLGYRL